MNSAHHLLSTAPDVRPPRLAPGLGRPGDGTRLTSNAIGQATGAQGGGQTFDHPWRPFLSGGRVAFNLGLVQSFSGEGPIVPVIDGVPMNGKDGTTRTPLDLSKVAVKSGVSWVILEVHPNDQGELMKDSKVELVHRADAIPSHALTFGRCPITMILWSRGAAVRALPIVHFHLRYSRVVPPAGGGAPIHRFL